MKVDSDEVQDEHAPIGQRPESPADQAIVSQRARLTIADQHHALMQELKTLHASHSQFQGALLACDSETQQLMLHAYRDQLHTVLSSVSRLCMLLGRIG